jgi:autotransporter family porin
LPIFKDLLYHRRALTHPPGAFCSTIAASRRTSIRIRRFISFVYPGVPAMQRPFVLLGSALLCICLTKSANAATYDWSNTSGGTFATAANWSPAGGPPNSNDTARFSLSNTYTVTLSGSATVNTLTQTQGDVTLNLSSATLFASNTLNNGMGSSGLTSSLHINTGSFFPGNFTVGGNAGSTSNLYLDTGLQTSVGSGLFYVGTSGTGNLTLQNGATLSTSFGAGLGINSSGVGTATVGAGSTWTNTNTPLRVGSSGTGTLNILANGAVTAFGLEVGENLNSIGTVSMSGNLATFTTSGTANIGGTLAASPAASATLNIAAGATMNLNGTTNLRTNARVNVSGGRLNLSTVNVATGALVNWTGGTISFATAPTITASMLDTLLAGTHTLGANRTLAATAGTLTLTTPMTFTGGTINVPILDLNANMNIGAFSTVSASDTVTLESGKTVQLGDFATLGATNSIINNGGTLQLEGPLANVTGFMANNAGFIRGTGRFTAGLNNGAGGTIRAEAGDDIIIDTVGPTNLGAIELAGGTVEYSKTLSNLAGGTISGRGVFRGSASAPGGNGLSNLGRPLV